MTTQTDDIKKLWNRAKALDEAIQEYRSIDTERAWQQTWQRYQRSQRRGFTFYLLRIAAILILPLLISTLTLGYLYINDHRQSQAIAYLEATSAPGIVTQITLPDSSKVWLNSGSRLRYPSRFVGMERNVTLQGEGYFEVQSDQQHPFYVATTDGFRVMAHGTKFNVNAYADDELIEATLEQGAVDILIGLQRETLSPGEANISPRQCPSSSSRLFAMKSISLRSRKAAILLHLMLFPYIKFSKNLTFQLTQGSRETMRKVRNNLARVEIRRN